MADERADERTAPCVTERRGDVCEAREQFIAHQCNCVTRTAQGVAKALFRAFPDADIYKARAAADEPGRIVVRGRVINMLAQRYPGRARYANDTAEQRLAWFAACLDEIGRLPEIGSLALPHGIGCGLAGGDWDAYRGAIETFAERHDVRVVLYKYDT